MKSIYVSCAAGDDRWSGALAAPNAARTDGPLRTLTAAQTAVRALKRGGGEAEVIEVVLAGGCYRLAETWRLAAADSGAGTRGHNERRTFPVIWRAAAGEPVTISGGQPLAGWRPATLNGQTVWRADVPWLTDDSRFFRQLWVNGERRPRARLPKRGTFRTVAPPDTSTDWTAIFTGTRRLGFRPGDLSAAWANPGAIDVEFRALWLASRVRLLAIDDATATASLDRDTQLGLAYAPGDGVDYIVENVREALSEPGEWCLDPVARCVWYLPRPDEQPEALAAVAGGLERLLELRDAKFLRFENLTFAHAEWRSEPTDAGAAQPLAQAAAKVSGAVFVGGGCEAVTFANCHIAQVGGYGLECADGAAEVVFQDGTLRDLGAGGVKIWHGCRRCVVAGSDIGDGGHLWLSGAGVLIGRASGNTVTHCHIHDFYYTGISVGWTWGYAESDAYGNVIEWNHIHDLGKGLLSDLGGVYLLGNAAGTRVRHNRIHDIRSLRYGGWGIYPDEGSSDLLIENNLCYRTDREVFHQHYGRNNLVRNNIFAYGGDAVLAYSRMEDHPGLSFAHNIILARGTPIVARVDDERWRADRTRFAGNLYWCEDGAVRFAGGWRNLATQPVRDRLADEAPRFRPLPAAGAVIRVLHAQGRGHATVEDAGEFRFARDGQTLSVTGLFAGAPGTGVPDQPPWGDWRAHLEVFLKPFALHPAMVRFCVTADGADSVTWYGCEGPKDFAWHRAVLPVPDGWSATLTVSLAAIASVVRGAGGIGEVMPVEYRALCSVALPIASLDFAAWQQHSGDRAGIVADPRFVAPERDDFRLRPDSPALALGFIPFACGPAGGRVPDAVAGR